MSRVLVFLADGFEEIEALTVVDYLRRAGIHVTTAALEDELLVRGAHEIHVQADRTVNDILGLPVPEFSSSGLQDLLSEWDAVILPGGMPGAKNLSEDPRVTAILQAQNARGGIVAAICAAPLALDVAGLLEDRHHTSFPGIREQLSNDEMYVDSEIVVTDENLTTSRGPGTAVYFALELIGQLVGEDKRQDVAEDLLLPEVEALIKGTKGDAWRRND